MARINWDRAKTYKRPPKKPKSHYRAISAAWEEWRRQKKDEYATYLETSWWKNRRKQKLARSGYKCEKCNSSSDLQVHHLNYKRLYHEKNRDLQVFCRPCHERIHDINQSQEHYAKAWQMKSAIRKIK